MLVLGQEKSIRFYHWSGFWIFSLSLTLQNTAILVRKLLVNLY